VTKQTVSPRRGVSRSSLVLLKVIASAALLYFVLSRIAVTEVLRQLEHAKYFYVTTAGTLALSIPVVLAFRWWLLARPSVGWSDALAFTWIGLFYGLFLPGGVSGDVAKGSILAWKNARTRVAALPASILVDRIVGLVVLLFFFCSACIVMAMSPVASAFARFIVPAGSIGALALCTILVAWSPIIQRPILSLLQRVPSPKLGIALSQFAKATFSYSGRLRLISNAGIVSIVNHALCVAMYLALLRSLTVTVGIFPVFALYSILSVLSMAPITIAGIGVRDWFATVFFSTLGLSKETGEAFAWLCLAMSVLQAIFGGAIQVFFSISQPKIDLPDR
jgi:uncharacterized protein (TIRG00374 family)